MITNVSIIIKQQEVVRFLKAFYYALVCVK